MAILNPLNDLVAWVIMRLHAGLGALFGPDSGWAWGLSIVFLVMIIRLCLVPLFVKQVNAQRKMAQHAPQLQELRKKYKNDKQRLNEETMKYYKENGVNPLAGCLPMIPQLIIFFSLFSVLRVHRRLETRSPAPVRVHPAGGGKRPESDHLRRSPLRQAAVPDRRLAAAVLARGDRDHTHRGAKRDDDVHDRPAERQAWSHADQHGPEQPDGPVAEVHAVHRAVLLADRAVLAVRPGALLGDDQPVDAGPAVLHVQELGPPAGRRRGRGGRRDHRRVYPDGAEPGPARLVGIRLVAAGLGTVGLGALGGAKTASGAKTAASGARNGTASGRQAAPGSAQARARAKDGTASGSARTGTARTGTASRPATTASRPATGQNGTEKRGLLRLGRAKAEPEPQDDVPTAKVVRQQPVRQAKSKRSGKR